MFDQRDRDHRIQRDCGCVCVVRILVLTQCVHADLNISADKIKRLGVKINKANVFRSTAQSLEPQCPGSGKEIENRGAMNLIAYDVEDCLPGPIRCRPDIFFPDWR